MDETLLWAQLASLAPAITALQPPETATMLLERVPTMWLDDDERRDGLRLTRFDPQIDLDQWERGRVFDAGFELRWERMGAMFQAVYCGAAAPLPGFQAADEPGMAQWSHADQGYFLWGAKVSERDLALIGEPPDSRAFVELQVPRVLHYPVSASARRVKIVVREYRDTSGALVYCRFLRLEEVP